LEKIENNRFLLEVLMYLAVRGKYKEGKIELLEKLEGIEESDGEM